jgi:thymidylate kinase
MIIAVEGLDASGKNTQTRALEKLLHPSQRISFPRYDGPFGQVIKKHLMEQVALCEKSSHTYPEQEKWERSPDDAAAFQALMTMDKYDAASEIRALDRKGVHVILDRYWPSACCYGADDGLDFSSMIRINSCLPQADLNILLDISVEEATRRRPEARDRYERDKKKLKHIRDRYLHMWEVMGVGIEKTGSIPWVVLNGEQDAAEITRQILAGIDTILENPNG